VQTPDGDAVRRAVALVESSALFDAEWYAARSARDFADRLAAITDYVRTSGRGGSPHPLFAARWLYPGGRWRRRSPDPLSDYLSDPERRRRSPHPLLDMATLLETMPGAADAPLGPVDAWVRGVAASTPLPTKVGAIAFDAAVAAMTGTPLGPPPASVGTTVLLLPPDLPDAAVMTVAWQRYLHRHGLRALVVADDPEVRPIVASVAASLGDSFVVDLSALPPAVGEILVVVRPTRRPAYWTDLGPLVAMLEDPEVSMAQAILVGDDQTVAAAGATWADGTLRPFLSGHPVDDAVRAGVVPLAGPWPGAVAVRGGDVVSTGSTDAGGGSTDAGGGSTDAGGGSTDAGGGSTDRFDEVALAARLPGRVVLAARTLVPATALSATGTPGDPEVDREAWRAAGFAAPREPVRVVEGRPALRWAIDTAGPFGGTRWGDYHFAHALADALAGLGQFVAVDHPETRNRASRDLDDVVLTIRGLERVAPPAGAVNLLWVISHPDDVDAAEVASYDASWAAGGAWAEASGRAWDLPIGVLLQATDPRRFHPGLAEPDSGPDLLFVGNRRRGERPAVLQSVAAGLPLSVYGAGWDGVVDVVADHVDNAELGVLYASAGIVLNDHWPDMGAAGFVSNRVFDVLATGARLLTDPVVGLDDVFPELPVFTGPEDLTRITRERDRYFPDLATRTALAERVVAEHSFAARAGVLLDAALRLRER
jgi:hypothetical protein